MTYQLPADGTPTLGVFAEPRFTLQVMPDGAPSASAEWSSWVPDEQLILAVLDRLLAVQNGPPSSATTTSGGGAPLRFVT